MKGIQVGYMCGPQFVQIGSSLRPTDTPPLLSAGQWVTYGGAKAVVAVPATHRYTYFELRVMIDAMGEAPR